jgi:hypothetical protein
MFGILASQTLRDRPAHAVAPTYAAGVWWLAIDSVTERRYSGAA